MADEVKSKTTPTRTTRKKVTRPSVSESASKSTTPVAEPPVKEESTAEPTMAQIKARAYEIYLARRGVGGDAHSDWLQAEQELRSQKKRS